MTLNLEDAQLQYLVNVLAQRPYAEVVELLDNIKHQVM